MTPDERNKKLQQEIHQAMDLAEELQRRINHQNKTDVFALALVLMTIGVLGLASLGIVVFSGGGV